ADLWTEMLPLIGRVASESEESIFKSRILVVAVTRRLARGVIQDVELLMERAPSSVGVVVGILPFVRDEPFVPVRTAGNIPEELAAIL
ncbi:MAG TPA: hypothetical protein VMW87_11225, partial [Spirochaetia bacterium]|nr:hypothetical protein [Spirochaetia bacterium]